MTLVLIAIAVLLGGSVVSLAMGRGAGSCRIGPAVAVAAGILGLIQALQVLVSGQAVSLHVDWSVPLGSLNLGLDPLSAVFLLPIAVVPALAAIYGSPYLQRHATSPSERTADSGQHLGRAWFFTHLLTAAMLVVVLARNGILFLFAWELMALSSFFLVLWDNAEERVRRAGWTYLVASHLGTTFLLAMFVLLAGGGEKWDFSTFRPATGVASAAFVLGVIGFGTKAGLVPLHVWLPEAHPAAPSHVSAIMSGVMIKTGLYGLLRLITLLGPVPAWWGWLLIGVGAVTGIWGISSALAQQDLKRLLAYSSVENMGIMVLGLGAALVGLGTGQMRVAALGLAGCLLHMLNHATFKSLLFLGAGAVVHTTHTRIIDRLGGLLKRMPITGVTFLIGAAAICGLPPLNGFVSELLIYLAALAGMTGTGPTESTAPTVLAFVLGALALIGGLAAVCFAKAFGIAFLGEPRTLQAAGAREACGAMRLPLLVLAAGCPLLGLLGWLLPVRLAPAVAQFLPADQAEQVAAELASAAAVLGWVALGGAVLALLVAALAAARAWLLAGREVGSGPTWDCGYAAPGPRMQYTGSSFVRPIVRFLQFLLRPRTELEPPRGLFPARAELHTGVPDVWQDSVYRPVFLGLRWLAVKLHRLQHGRIQVYVLYIAVMLLVLLMWKLG